MYRLYTPSKDEHPVLLTIWETSVKATHHFLTAADIENLKKIIEENELFSLVSIISVRDESNNIIAFMGVTGNNLEMLFIHPNSMGKGIGKMLLQHAINNLYITKVDVNEQNEQAVTFYERFGFKTVSRSELDGQGNPFPILHMELS